MNSCAKQPYPYLADGGAVNEVDTSWTTWNKSILGLAIAGSVVDAQSTIQGLDRGCEEANPILGKNPSDASIILLKVGILGALYLITEYLVPDVNRQTSRNWFFGAYGVVGLAAGIYN